MALIFRVRSAQKLALTDGVLLRHLCLLVLLYCSYLTAWTALQPPLVETARTSNDLKYERCIENWFDHTLIFGKTGGHTRKHFAATNWLVWDYRFYEKDLLRDETLSPLHVAWNSTGLNLCYMTQISNASRRSVHIRVGIAETALYNQWSQVRAVHCRPYSVYRLVREDHSVFTPYHKTKLTDVSLLHCIKWHLRHYLRNKPTKPSWKKGNQNGFED